MTFKIPFNKPCYTGNEDKYVLNAMRSLQISGNGPYTKKCEKWFEEELKCKRALLVPSGTHALEMAALLIDVQPGDEIIMPSYTFVSTANAFALRGAKIVFVDIKPDTMNIDENLIEQAVTEKTRAICVVHYAGVACSMDKILEIARKYNLFVIEDAAQGIMSKYKDRPLGTIGHLGCYSFHETKNYTSAGEGGLLIINNEEFVEKAEIIREKGTNRNQFFRGMVDKYTWIDIGSSFLMNDVSAAYLWGQLEWKEIINNSRLKSWGLYYIGLSKLESLGVIELPKIPSYATNNGHIFYIKVKNLDERTKLLNFLRENGIYAVFHYVPLHSSPAGLKFGRFFGEDVFTTKESERLIRLPLFYSIKVEEINYVVNEIYKFYDKENIL
ncbi:dTDP-4-amino-4,6-dideoxygalactose transaminase [Bacteroidetes/Chlorobi group bacterium MS-B_bin-24]|nr:MAG: dTDP-4-amino-4,6-dideoxygalactose transaminase [Bacteroidetes/Chlorobi group bacterium MS-B_bin-24]